jgi:hypothetical protein
MSALLHLVNVMIPKEVGKISELEFVILIVRHVTGNDQDYLRKIPRAVVQISALL